MASYTWGKDADRFDGLSSEEVIEKTVEDMAAIHGQTVDFIKKNLRDGVVKQWANDQFTLGGFAMFAPYQVIYFVYYEIPFLYSKWQNGWIVCSPFSHR